MGRYIMPVQLEVHILWHASVWSASHCGVVMLCDSGDSFGPQKALFHLVAYGGAVLWRVFCVHFLYLFDVYVGAGCCLTERFTDAAVLCCCCLQLGAHSVLLCTGMWVAP